MAFVVWSTPHADVTDDFERWYNEVHLPDAIDNGSFVAMHRYEAVGPGYRAAPYLSIAEADYANEAEAWAAVRPAPRRFVTPAGSTTSTGSTSPP